MAESAAQLGEKIRNHFREIGVPVKDIKRWWRMGNSKSYPRTLETLKKIWKNRPSKKLYEKWCAAPKGLLSSLQGAKGGGVKHINGKPVEELTDEENKGIGVRYPTLCGWTQMQVIRALHPFIYELIEKFRTPRCDVGDCYNNGAMGVLHALRTDAGVSAFASHAFPRIKTMIRRASANSGVIRKPERKPSRTEVRRAITAWLRGKLLDHERDIRANRHIGKTAHAPVTGYKAIKGAAVKKKIDKNAKERLKALEELGAPLNKQPLITKADLSQYPVQKIGRRDVCEDHVSEKVALTRFTLDKLLDLFDYLDVQFGSSRDPSVESYFEMDADRFHTVGDLVNRVADSPDFHGNPLPLSVEVDDGYSLHEVVPDLDAPVPQEVASRHERAERAKILVRKMRQAMELSPAQEMVFVNRFGLDGNKELSGAEVADNYGALMDEKDGRTVSRQRITQHERVLHKKIVDAAFEVLFLDGQDKELLETAVDKAELSPQQRSLVCQRHGLKGATEHDIASLASNFEDLTGGKLPRSLKRTDRERVVTEMLRKVKQTLVGASL